MSRIDKAVRFIRIRNRKSGLFARERVRVHGQGEVLPVGIEVLPVGIRLALLPRYPPTEFDYVLEESKSCEIAHGPIEWRVHAIRQVGECQSCGTLFDCLNIDLAHEAALEREVDDAHYEARERHCSSCGTQESLGILLFGDRIVELCLACQRLKASA